NQLDVLGKAFLGQTIACARCHDHKFDAISTRDYYALAGYLRSSRYQQAFIDRPAARSKVIEELGALRSQIEDRAKTELAKKWLKESEQASQYLLAADGVKVEDDAALCSAADKFHVAA